MKYLRLTTCFLLQGIPIGLVVLGIVSFKTGRFEEMFDWTTTSSSYHYMPRWVSGNIGDWTLITINLPMLFMS